MRTSTVDEMKVDLLNLIVFFSELIRSKANLLQSIVLRYPSCYNTGHLRMGEFKMVCPLTSDQNSYLLRTTYPKML